MIFLRLPKNVASLNEFANANIAKFGSANGEKSAVHVVSAWASSLGVCFGQVKTAEKSNVKLKVCDEIKGNFMAM